MRSGRTIPFRDGKISEIQGSSIRVMVKHSFGGLVPEWFMRIEINGKIVGYTGTRQLGKANTSK